MDYPRPQLRRPHWRSLNGAWAFAFSSASDVHGVDFDRTIEVPYAPETPRSGIGDQGFHGALWYRQRFMLTDQELPAAGERLLLHFGAVDWSCRIWVNGQPAGEHIGGYTPFELDVTGLLHGPELTVVLRAEDDPHDLHRPRGKQDWQAQPHDIWYPRTSGIWQTVWLERVPPTRIGHLRWTPDLNRFALGLELETVGYAPGLRLRARVSLHSEVIFDSTSSVRAEHSAHTLSLPDPGFEDVRADWLWSPEHPQLLDVTLELYDEWGGVLDSVQSYTALRSAAVSQGRFLLNGQPYLPRMVLDQGYWQDGGLSASSEELRSDVELIKRLGFNGARKHQKIEDPRFLYWADTLGLLVWEELPSAYAFSPRATRALTDTWTAAIRRDASHPCIVAWVPFNESWGVTDLARDARQSALVQALYHLTRALDGSRPVIGNDGWEHPVGDILSIHDYASDPEVLRARYASAQTLAQTLGSFWPGGRQIALPEFRHQDQPAMLTEFGGIALRKPKQRGWGYSEAQDARSFLERYQTLMAAVHDSPVLSGFCYTQLTDTYQEINGLTDMARRPKADIEQLAAATLGYAPDPLNPLGSSPRWLSRQPQQQKETYEAFLP